MLQLEKLTQNYKARFGITFSEIYHYILNYILFSVQLAFSHKAGLKEQIINESAGKTLPRAIITIKKTTLAAEYEMDGNLFCRLFLF